MLVFPCPSCGAKLQMADDLAGKKVRCAGCQTVVTAPNVSEMVQADDAPARSRAVTAGKSAPRRSADDDDADDRPRRSSGSDAAATAAVAAGAGIGIVGIMAIVGAIVGVLGCCGVAVVGIALMVPGVQRVREAATRAQTINNLKQIALAEHNFHDTNMTLPPPKLMKGPNQPAELSWRVAILPYIEQGAVFQRFDKNSAWDSPANRPLLSPMSMVYEDVLLDGNKKGTTDTRFQYFTGPGTLWPDGTTRRTFGEFTAGTSNTIMVAESSNPVPWSKPADMAIQPGQALPLPQDRFIAAMADGSVRMIDRRRASDAIVREYLDPRNNNPHQPIE